MPSETSDQICAIRSAQVGEPLVGTATRTVGWLLVERPGSWGPDTLIASGLDPQVAVALGRWESSAAGNVRVQLIRRPRPLASRPPSTGTGLERTTRRAYLAYAGENPWIRRFNIERDSDLLELPLAHLDSPTPPRDGEPVDARLLLVCTHGSRDRCCAQFGRPIAEALCAMEPSVTATPALEIWETSHVGGHRWAANVAVLPDGLLYGRITAEEVPELVAATQQGRLLVERLRGRSAWPAAAQAAEIFARRHLSDDRSAIRLVELRDAGHDNSWQVVFTVGAAKMEVRVAQQSLDDTVLTSCRAAGGHAEMIRPEQWVLVGISGYPTATPTQPAVLS